MDRVGALEMPIMRRLVAMTTEEREEHPDGLIIRRRPTQIDLHNMVGACRETVSRTFADFTRKLMAYARSVTRAARAQP
jgi:hypothetical protein